MSPQDIEVRRLVTQALLDAERSAVERNQLGQFATPPLLAEEIVREALQYLPAGQPVRFLDPTIGSGAFYSALLRTVAPERIESAAGSEIDRRFVAAARELWSGFGLEITEGDFTRLSPPALDRRANLLVANPPYVRHHHLEGEDKVRLKQQAKRRLSIDVSGLAGLYVHCLLLSLDWMADDGVAAWLIPSEWMDVNYGRAVKRFLTQHVTLLHVHLFEASDVRFEDALVSSSVVFFRKARPHPEQTVRLSAGSDLEQPRIIGEVSLSTLSHTDKWSASFRKGEAPNRNGASKATIGDLFRIRRGIATGANSFFIRPRAEFLKLGIPDQFLRPVLPPSRLLQLSVVEAGPDGYPALPVPLALLDCPLAEEEVRSQHPALWSYLSSPEAEEARSGYLAKGRKLWYSQEVREPSRYLSTYMGRGRNGTAPFRFFLNRSAAIGTNVYLMLYPQGSLAERLQNDHAAEELVLQLLMEIATAGFEAHGRVYGGGLHKLEPKELASLPADRIIEALDLRTPAGAQFNLSLG